MNIIQMSNLFDTRKIQQIQDELAIATDLAIIMVDYRGNPVTNHSNCSLFCAKVREIEALNQLCEKCDSRGGLEAVRSGNAFVYKCHFGLVDFSVPIIINDQYMGALMAGQVNLQDDESMQLEWIVSKRSQTDIEEYPELKSSYAKIPLINHKKLNAVAHLIELGIRYIVDEALIKKDLYEDVQDVQSYYNREFKNDETILQPAYDYIDQHYKEKIRLTEMANLCNISSSYFSKLFKKENGIGFNAFINEIKLDKSIKLLENKDLPIINLSLELGYEDCSYFIRLFKKKYGVTPANYRKSTLNN
jgi:ligand-binding sensor protein/AraC-like DNA-binding protein